MQLIKYHFNRLYTHYNIVWLQYSQEGQDLYSFNTWKKSQTLAYNGKWHRFKLLKRNDMENQTAWTAQVFIKKTAEFK